jgi:hypothetical protein
MFLTVAMSRHKPSFRLVLEQKRLETEAGHYLLVQSSESEDLSCTPQLRDAY